MSWGQVFIGLIGVLMACGVFFLLRFPQYRRIQFQHYGAFSVKTSLAGAVAVLVIVAVMILCQADWENFKR